MMTLGPTNGSLLIHGGGNINSIVARFVALAGGPGADIVYIPTAEEDANISANGDVGKFHGLEYTVLHTRDRAEADSESFVDPIKNAAGVFIDGGRQPRLAESYLNTRTHHELQNLLDRGGVIAGSSAGAMIMSDFLVRGEGYPNIDDNKTIIGDHIEGFGFIKNIAFDVHVHQYQRDADLAVVLNAHPGLLGVGIDEDTAIHVRGNEFEVLGSSRVLIHDGTRPVRTLTRGDAFDMYRRVAV